MYADEGGGVRQRAGGMNSKAALATEHMAVGGERCPSVSGDALPGRFEPWVHQGTIPTFEHFQ